MSKKANGPKRPRQPTPTVQQAGPGAGGSRGYAQTRRQATTLSSLTTLPLPLDHLLPGESELPRGGRPVGRPRGEDWGLHPAATWVPHPGAETEQQHPARLFPHSRSWMIMDVCCFKLLCLGQFITQQ